MNKRNASASALGWDFQTNAAIVLMLENIKEARRIRVEGEYEDIEIFLEDKSKIYSQVKAVEKPDDYTHVLDKLESALETLDADALNGDGRLYTYITNSPNPFNNQRTMSYFTGNTHLYFNELPEKAQDRIKKIITQRGFKNIDQNKLDIRVIPFYGSDLKNRYKEIQAVVNEILQDINPSLDGVSTEILPLWQGKFFQNATQPDTAISIDKEEMIWPLIVLITYKSYANDYKRDFDEEEIEEIERKYKYVMNETLRYEFLTKVISDFQESGNSVKDFVEENWSKYITEIDKVEADNDTKKVLMQLILYRILEQRHYINDIKKGVNL